MQITIIHGQTHKGSTYQMTQLLLENLSHTRPIVHEFFLPTDTPNFCTGCFSCIKNGEHTCPHKEKVQPIAESLELSNMIIVDSPTYGMEMSGQLKTLFDHLCYQWLPHRPNPAMFHKVAVVVSSAAGSGAKRVTKSLANQLFWMGVPKIYLFHVNIGAASWNEVTDKTKARLSKKSCRLANGSLKHHRVGIKLKLMFNLMRLNQKSNKWNLTDKNYWQQKGWLERGRPWKL